MSISKSNTRGIDIRRSLSSMETNDTCSLWAAYHQPCEDLEAREVWSSPTSSRTCDLATLFASRPNAVAR